MNRFLAALLVTLSAAVSAQALVDGEVKKVDRPAARITVRHGEVPQFDMPAMTGSYKVADPGMLDRVQPGDHVRFSLERVHDQYTITRIDVQK